ncbi:hypothetical protein [Telluria antibiotica]|nr:hypothetical protein [Telluria antibiotica]
MGRTTRSLEMIFGVDALQRHVRPWPVKARFAALLLAGMLPNADATEDTDTPGARNWEINIVVSGERTAGGREYAVPAADVNYGLGERTQLVLAVPHLMLREPGTDTRSGLGSATVGFKWRFMDLEQAGVALAMFPAYSWSLSASSVERGLSDPGHSLLLPLVLGVHRGDNALFVEAGRNLVQAGPNEWLAGVKLTRQCMATVECRVEVGHTRVAGAGSQTLASAGFKWRLAEHLVLQGSVGRDVGPARDDKRQVAFTFGIQLLL